LDERVKDSKGDEVIAASPASTLLKKMKAEQVK